MGVVKVLKRTVTIENPNLSARSWDLYTHTETKKMQQRCALAANDLNKTFTASVNAGKNRNEVYRDMMAVMLVYSDTGACDSEPMHLLDDMLDEVFGEE
jgi:hypothetical protein